MDEIKEWISIIKKYLDAIDNKNRREILKLCSSKPKTISKLKRLLNSSNKVTWNNVRLLKEVGLVTLNKKKKEKYHPVYVQSLISPEKLGEVINDFSKDLPKMLKSQSRKVKI